MREKRKSNTSWRAAVNRRVTLARVALIWEHVWPALWPLLGVAGLFVAVSLLGIWNAVPRWAHLVVVSGFALAALAASADGFRRVRLPSYGEAERRLEQDSGLAHRPLGVLADRPAAEADDPAVQALWRAHQERARRDLRKLRLVWPRPFLIRRDPFALRYALILVLAVALAAGKDGFGRLLDGFRLGGVGMANASIEMEAWITPPAYTGVPPRFLDARRQNQRPENRNAGKTGQNAIWVPKGSVLSVRAGGMTDTPELAVHGRDVKKRNLRFTEAAAHSYALSYALTADQTISLLQGSRTIARWSVRIVPDTPPIVAFAKPPGATARFALAIPYLAEDDYGIASVQAVIRLARTAPSGRDSKPLLLELSLPGGHPRHALETSYHDLTNHPWAGLPVTNQLVAKDAAGQTGLSAVASMVLPEREFHDPLAKALVEQRKALVADPANGPDVARALDALSLAPDRFAKDRILYLGLRATYWRLRNAEAGSVPDGTTDLLWALALRAEDGDLSLAERDLRDVQQRLKNALDRNAGQEELDSLTNQLQQMLDRYVDALAQQAAREAARTGQTPKADPDEMKTRRKDLHDAVEQARRLGEAGSRDAARSMLSQLQAMLENLQAGIAPGQSEAQRRERERALDELSRLMDRQQKLLDKTFQQSQDAEGSADPDRQSSERRSGQAGRGAQSNGNGGTDGDQAGTPNDLAGRRPGNGNGGGPGAGQGANGDAPNQSAPGEGEPGEGGAAAQQEALRRQLGELMGRIGEGAGSIPGALGRAERSMRDAREALGQGRPGDAVQPQRHALDQLQQGTEAIARQQQDSDEAQSGLSNGGPSAAETDPLGRPMPTSGPDLGLGQSVPDAPEVERSRRILEEIERRASERARPQDELEYLDRLLRRF